MPRNQRTAKGSDREFDNELWKLIPRSMRLQPSTSLSPPQPEQTRRPSISDTVDNSGTRVLIHEARRLETIKRVRGSPSSSDATLSPTSPSRKRRNSNQSTSKSNKKPVCSQPSSRESSASTEDMSRMRMDDGNPFKVGTYFDSILQGASGSCSSRPQDQLQRTSVIYRSQQHTSYSRRDQPSTPPTLRHRGRSLGPESPGGSPARIDMHNWPLHADSEALHRVEDEVMQGDWTPTRRRNHEGQKVELVRTDGPHFTAADQMSDSQETQETQTPQKPRRHFKQDVVPSTVERKDVDMVLEAIIALEDAKTPTRVGGRRLSISSVSTRSLHNDSPISVRTISRRHSIAEIESPIFKTPTRSRRKSSFGRVLRDDGSLSSGRISSLPEGSPMGIDWSQSLETPAKRREAQGIAKTPIANVIQRLRGMPTTPASKGGEEQSIVGEFSDWNPSLETPPRKASLTNKRNVPESKISAKVLNELRGIPSDSRAAPPQSADKQHNMSSQEGSFYSAASSIISDGDDDYQNAAGIGSMGTGTTVGGVDTDQQRAQDGGNGTVNTNEIYPADSKISPAVSVNHDDPVAGIPLTTNVHMGSPRSISVQDVAETSPVIDSPMQSPVFPESQDAMFEGVTSAEINQALMSRSTQGSHHMTQPEEDQDEQGELPPAAAGSSDWSHNTSRPIGGVAASPIGFWVSGGRLALRVSQERLRATRRLAEGDPDEAAGSGHKARGIAAGQVLAFNMLEAAGTSVPGGVDADEIHKASRLKNRVGQASAVEEQYGERLQVSPEVDSDDDFGNIRLSQLDDGFNVVPEATQKPRKSSSASIMTKKTPRIADDIDWMARTSDMMGDMFNGNEFGTTSHQEPRPHVLPPTIDGGLSSASGKKLAPISKAALAKAASMFEDGGGDVGDNTHPGPEGGVPEQSSTFSGGFGGFGGFSSAGKKPLPQISGAAMERAMRMMQDSGIENDNSDVKERARSSATSSMHMHSGPRPQQLGGGGFTSGSGKKLAPASDAAMDKWSKELMGDDLDAGGFQGKASLPPVSFSGVPSLGGFSSGNGKRLAPPSKAAMDMWSKELMDDEGRNNSQGNAPVALNLSRGVPPLGGFSSGSGKTLASISTAALDKWSKELMGDESGDGMHESLKPTPAVMSGVPSLGAFSSGSGKKLAPASKAAMDKWSKEFDEDLDESGSRRASEPGRSQRPVMPMLEVGFSTSSGKKLAPISKEAQAHAYGLLEMPVLKTGTTPFKSPLIFKSPLRALVPPMSSNTTTAPASGQTMDVSRGPATAVQLSTTFTANTQSGAPRKSIGKRPTLHPAAREAPTALISSPAQPFLAARPHASPSYSPVFNLQAQRDRTTLKDTLRAPKHLTTPELVDRGLHSEVLCMTFEQARNYSFEEWGVDNAYQELLVRGAKADLLSKSWLLNHYGQIVWKLACYVRTWPEYFQPAMPGSSGWFCPANVLDQLAYRYEREVNKAERPALRKIVEGDESAAKHMVLVIASVSKTDESLAKGGAEQESPWKILVSDGWYTIPAVLDPCLIRAVERGKLKVGSKIHVCRSKLSGAESGVAILELAGAGSESTTVSIMLQANSTRLARWDTKLGFQRAPMIWTRRLRSIVPEGGLVPGLDVVVLRKYPVMYLETLEDGVTKVKRTEKEESQAVEAHREKIQQRYQDMVREIEKEFASEMDVDGHPSGRVQEEIMIRAQDMQAEATARNVIPFFSIRVGNYRHGDICDDDDMDETGRVQEALVTFWHAEHTPYQEGHRVRVTSLMSKKLSREHGLEEIIQLTGTRMTTVQEMPTEPDTMLLTSYRPRLVTPSAEVGHLSLGTEIDLVLIILAVGEITTYSNKAYFVVTDASRQLLLVEHQLSQPLLNAAAANAGEDTTRPMPSFLKVQNRILMANARFKLQDHKLNLGIVSSLQSYTQITTASTVSGAGGILGSNGWPGYAQSSLQRLDTMVAEAEQQGGEGGGRQGEEESFLELMSRATSILTELQR
ncbi:Breast cancer 2, early onset [Mortierella sp. AD032]|nr:Breast cancer 2, early onset [Mortierella sp. AD032]